jgi:hypothetical protein
MLPGRPPGRPKVTFLTQIQSPKISKIILENMSLHSVAERIIIDKSRELVRLYRHYQTILSVTAARDMTDQSGAGMALAPSGVDGRGCRQEEKVA